MSNSFGRLSVLQVYTKNIGSPKERLFQALMPANLGLS
jgi:hypothetical protein